MMIDENLPSKHSKGFTTSFKAEKRKIGIQTAIKELKVVGNHAEKTRKAPLKAELIVKLKVLEKEHEALKLENEALKSENKSNLEINKELKRKIVDLEKIVQETKQRELNIGDTIDDGDLDLSFGPRYCNKCGYEAEDGYQLDGHLWSEHEEADEEKSLSCQHCIESFSTLKELMIHKKSNHAEKVSICWHFVNGVCPFGDKNCWFIHEERNIESVMMCNICGETLKSKKDFMIHRKQNHEKNVQICELIKKGNCTYNEKCWFSHRIVENLTNNENENQQEK